MPEREEEPLEDARKFNEAARDALHRHHQDADVARYIADEAALDLKTRKDYRKKRTSQGKEPTTGS